MTTPYRQAQVALAEAQMHVERIILQTPRDVQTHDLMRVVNTIRKAAALLDKHEYSKAESR